VSSKPWSGRETDRAYEESLAERRGLRADVDALRRDIWINRLALGAIAGYTIGKPILGMIGLVIP
jgi:hypothetical protein